MAVFPSAQGDAGIMALRVLRAAFVALSILPGRVTAGELQLEPRPVGAIESSRPEAIGSKVAAVSAFLDHQPEAKPRRDGGIAWQQRLARWEAAIRRTINPAE